MWMGQRQAALGTTWHSQAAGSSVVWLSKGWARLLCVRVCWHIKLRSSSCSLANPFLSASTEKFTSVLDPTKSPAHCWPQTAVAKVVRCWAVAAVFDGDGLAAVHGCCHFPCVFSLGIIPPEVAVHPAAFVVEQLHRAAPSCPMYECVCVMDGGRQGWGFMHALTDGLCRP